MQSLYLLACAVLTYRSLHPNAKIRYVLPPFLSCLGEFPALLAAMKVHFENALSEPRNRTGVG